MRTAITFQFTSAELNKLLKDKSQDFPEYRQWLAKNKSAPPAVVMVRTLQAINHYWSDLKYDKTKFNAFLVFLFRQIADHLHEIATSSQTVCIVRDLFAELKTFLTKTEVTFKSAEDKHPNDVLPLASLFETLSKRMSTPPSETKKLPTPTLFNHPSSHSVEDKSYLNIERVVESLTALTSPERALMNPPELSRLIGYLGSLADRWERGKTICLNGRADFNGLVDLLGNALGDSKNSSALLLSLGKLAAANLLSKPLSLDLIKKLLEPLLEQKKPQAQECRSALQGLAQLMTALKVSITSMQNLDIKALYPLVIPLIQASPPPSGGVIADVWQSLERIHFYSDNSCEIPLEILLQVLELVGRQSEIEYKEEKISSEDFIKQVGSTILSIGQLVETNIPLYYPCIAGTKWIKTIDYLFELLAGVLNSEKMTTLSFPKFKYLIFALNGRVLSGKSLSDPNSQLVFNRIIAHNYLEDNPALSYSERQARLKLARQLYLYALVTHQVDRLPPKMIVFLEKYRPEPPLETSFEATVVKELKKSSDVVTQVGMETGPVLYPFDISAIRKDSVRVDAEMKGPSHLTQIQPSKDLFRDGVISYTKMADAILPFFWRDKPTVAGVVSEILKAKPQWNNRERPEELYEWITKTFSLKPSLSTTTITESLVPVSAPQISVQTKKKPAVPAEKKVSLSKPVDLTQWIELATQGTVDSFEWMQTFLSGWEDESMSVVVLLAVLTKSLRTTDQDQKIQLQKMSKLLIQYIKPATLRREELGVSPLLLARMGGEKYKELVKLMEIDSAGAPSKRLKKNKKRKDKRQTAQLPATPVAVLDPNKFSLLPDTPQAWSAWREQLSIGRKEEKIPACSPDLSRRIVPPRIEKLLMTDHFPLSDIPRLSLWAKDGNPSAQCYLGIYYHDGIGVERNLTEAMKWWRCSAEQGYVAAQLFLAERYDRDERVRDIPQAIRWFRAAAEQGNPIAQFKLGEFYRHGNEHVAPDFGQAFNWYRSAASNYAPAIHKLGLCYMHGLGVGRDWKEAVHSFHKAIIENEEQKDYEIKGAAYCDLGACYLTGGYGIDQYSEQAIRYFKLSADLNCSAGQFCLATCYMEGKGVKPNSKKAEKLLLSQVAKGDVQAQCQLGEWYAYGKCGESKKKEGIKLLQAAIEQKYSPAFAILGDIYYQGDGVARNQIEALRLWELAAKQNNSFALAKLGTCYLEGKDVIEDKKKAFKYFRLAVQGDQPKPGMYLNLGRCYQYGYGVPESLNEALRWYKLAEGNHQDADVRIAQVLYSLHRYEESLKYFNKAAEEGHPQAQLWLGFYFENDKPNLALAQYWYAKSAAQGNEKAKERLTEVREKLLVNRLKNTGSPLAGRQKTSHATTDKSFDLN